VSVFTNVSKLYGVHDNNPTCVPTATQPLCTRTFGRKPNLFNRRTNTSFDSEQCTRRPSLPTNPDVGQLTFSNIQIPWDRCSAIVFLPEYYDSCHIANRSSAAHHDEHLFRDVTRTTHSPKQPERYTTYFIILDYLNIVH
jgi:hypothetical protein